MTDIPHSGQAPETLLAIVTVTLNNLDGLKTTLRSVKQGLALRPDLTGAVEIVVKDGGSSDGTAAYLRGLSQPDLRVSSGPDGGIYPAMNEALGLVSARWVMFLNAGDRLASPEVLGRLVDHLAASDGGTMNFVYSDCLYGQRVLHQTLSVGFLAAHMINHQSVCYRRDLLRTGYDLRYRYCADYAHLLMVYSKLCAEKFPVPISAYDASGVSSDPRNYHRMWRERLTAVWRSPLPLADRLRLSRRGVFMWPLQRIRALFL